MPHCTEAANLSKGSHKRGSTTTNSLSEASSSKSNGKAPLMRYLSDYEEVPITERLSRSDWADIYNSTDGDSKARQ